MGPILVVDDNHDNAELLRLVLTMAGYEVAVAHDPAAAVALAAEVHPALAVLDLHMPGRDEGLALARTLRADPATSGTVLVALTGAVEIEDRLAAEDAGFDGFLTKPIDTRAFPKIVAGYLERTGGAAHGA